MARDIEYVGQWFTRWREGGEWRRLERKEGEGILFHKYRTINLGTRVSINLLPSGENTVYGMNGRRGGESGKG